MTVLEGEKVAIPWAPASPDWTVDDEMPRALAAFRDALGPDVSDEFVSGSLQGYWDSLHGDPGVYADEYFRSRGLV